MTQLFHAAICSQCGGSLDLKTLKCESCSVQHMLNFSKSIPSIAADIPDKEYFIGRDRRVDSVLLLMLQQIATESKLEVALALSRISFGSRIHVHAKLPHNGQWLEVGTISVENNQYNVCSHQSSHRTYGNAFLSWQTDLSGNPGDRFYTLRDKILRGENELLGCNRIKRVFSLMIENALKSNQDLKAAEELARIKASRPIGWLDKLLGA